LGTLVEVAATGSAATLPGAIEAAFSAIELVQRLMSFHDENSDVSRINAAHPGVVVNVDAHTYTVLEYARRLSERTGGAFDITVASILVRNGFLPQRSRASQSDVVNEVTFRDLELLAGNQVRWRRLGCIDLGGIAKGYAVDCAVAAMKSTGVVSGVVNAGGDLRCFGDKQAIHVRRPDAPAELLALGWLREGAIATSAGYFAGVQVDGRQIDPLVDPQSRNCVAWGDSVSVVAAECMAADALTKVVRLAPMGIHDLLTGLEAQAVVIKDRTASTCGLTLLEQDGEG